MRKWLLPELGACALKDLDGQRLQAFVSGCRCNAKTISNLVATLRMMWNSARAWGYVAHDPFDALVLPKRGMHKTFALSLEETRRIIELADEPYKTFHSILAETGIRGGEICALRVADLDLRTRSSTFNGACGGAKFKR